MNDALKIFELYLEAVEEQPKMTTDKYGNKTWYLHGKLHREDGAAIEWADGFKAWYLHGELHREDGAAIEWADGSKAWWLHGKPYETAEQWAKEVLKLHNKPHDDAAVDAFLRTILKKDAEAAL